MAASFTNTARIHFGSGFPQRYMETGTITYDSDATVEVDTALSEIENWSFSEAVSGGSLDLPSIDETFANGTITVDADGQITVDTAANSTRVFTYQLIGY